MSEHLPECLMNLEYAVRVCICPELRACEQRVRESDEPWIKASAEANLQSYDEGYSAALNAAREAVVALEPRLNVAKYAGGYDCYHCCGCSTTYDLMEDALAAIDALREKP